MTEDTPLIDKAFRHGDIENILENLAKTAAAASIGGSGLLNIAVSVVKNMGGPAKFDKSDIKKVYFVSRTKHPQTQTLTYVR